MARVTEHAVRRGDAAVLTFFDEFLSVELIDRSQLPTNDAGELIIAGVRGSDRFGEFCSFACEDHEKVTFALVPTGKMPPLVVFTLECVDHKSDACPLDNETNFDMLMAAELFCDSWERDERTFRTEVLWPTNFSSPDPDGLVLAASDRERVLSSEEARTQLGLAPQQETDGPCA